MNTLIFNLMIYDIVGFYGAGHLLGRVWSSGRIEQKMKIGYVLLW
jgi:hypothetical protein